MRFFLKKIIPARCSAMVLLKIEGTKFEYTNKRTADRLHHSI